MPIGRNARGDSGSGMMEMAFIIVFVVVALAGSAAALTYALMSSMDRQAALADSRNDIRHEVSVSGPSIAAATASVNGVRGVVDGASQSATFALAWDPVDGAVSYDAVSSLALAGLPSYGQSGESVTVDVAAYPGTRVPVWVRANGPDGPGPWLEFGLTYSE